MIFDPHFQNRDSDTHESMSWEDISRPSDSYSEPIHYSQSARRTIIEDHNEQ